MLVMQQELDLNLPPRPESVAEARLASAGLLEGLSDATRDGVTLIVSELVTNALKHGPEAPVRLKLRRDGDGIRGEVEDEGDGKIQIRAEAERSFSSGGYGLHIVDVVSDSWGVQEGSTRVWFELSD